MGFVTIPLRAHRLDGTRGKKGYLEVYTPRDLNALRQAVAA